MPLAMAPRGEVCHRLQQQDPKHARDAHGDVLPDKHYNEVVQRKTKSPESPKRNQGDAGDFSMSAASFESAW